MRIFLSMMMGLLTVVAISSLSVTTADAAKRNHRPVLKNDHLSPPGYGYKKVRRHRHFRKHKYTRHQRHSVRSGFSSRYRTVDTSRRSFWQHGQAQRHQHVSGKYRNRTQFCRRAWEIVSGREVIVRRCVWVHNSKLRGTNAPAIEGH